MMKKIYMTPAAQVIRIEKTLLTSASLGVYSEEVTNTEDLLGRDYDFDEDEEY